MTKALISPAELASMTDVVVIDTRSPDAYAAGHIPGAVNLHDIFTYLATSDAEGLAAMRTKFAEAFGAAGLSGAETAVLCEQSMNTGFGQSCRGYFLLSSSAIPRPRCSTAGSTPGPPPVCRSRPIPPRPSRRPSPPATPARICC